MKKIWSDKERAETPKLCRRCDGIKSLLEFYKHSQMQDGHLNKCIKCVKEDVAIYRAANSEKIRAYDRKRSTLPHRLELNKKTCLKFRKDFPLKYRAQTVVNNAVRDGRLIKPEICEGHNKKGRQIEGHHDDYSKPLEVVWLCSACHKQLHRDLRDI